MALGASITAGVRGDAPPPGEIGDGHVVPFADYLADEFDVGSRNFDFANLAVPGATSGDILRDQLPSALAFAADHPERLVITVAGGGNDLLQFLSSPEFLPCLDPGAQQQCQINLAAVLTRVGDNMGQLVATLRQAAPHAVILVRDQYNALLSPGCGDPAIIPLSQLAIDNLNATLNQVADAFADALVVTADDFARNPWLVGADCVHPTDRGYRRILSDFRNVADRFEDVLEDDD